MSANTPLLVAFWKPGTMPAGIPVSRIATRSSRGAGERFEVREHSRVEDRQQLRQFRVLHVLQELNFFAAGSCAFHSSLRAIGISTSLNSGFARRETCTQGPDSECSSLAPSAMRILRRLAEPQTPSTAFGLITFLGTEPSSVSALIGTWIAIVWTLSVCSVSTPGRRRRRDQVQVLESDAGRPRSKIDPMSTKNGSLRCPANTVWPPGSEWIASCASAS